jgi:hypothetical protein
MISNFYPFNVLWLHISQLVQIFFHPTETVFGPLFWLVLKADPTIVAGVLDDVEDVIVVDLAGRIRLMTVRYLRNLDVT